MWLWNLTLDRAARQEATERATYALKAYGVEAEAYLHTKIDTPGRSKRSRLVLRLALREVERLRGASWGSTSKAERA